MFVEDEDGSNDMQPQSKLGRRQISSLVSKPRYSDAKTPSKMFVTWFDATPLKEQRASKGQQCKADGFVHIGYMEIQAVVDRDHDFLIEFVVDAQLTLRRNVGCSCEFRDVVPDKAQS